MPEKRTLERARADKRAGKSPSTQAGEFVREEIERVRAGKHGARSARQVVAIGLSKARRAGVELPPPRADRTSEATRHKAETDLAAARGPRKAPSRARSKATLEALKRESPNAASPLALKRQAKAAAARRTPAERSQSARKAARTLGPSKRSAGAKKAAATRARNAAGKR